MILFFYCQLYGPKEGGGALLAKAQSPSQHNHADVAMNAG